MPLVLVADDDPDIRELLRDVLAGAGFDVVAAGDGQTALDLIRRQRPDVAVLDLVLPELTGWEVVKRLAREEDHAPPVVILSAAPPDLFSLPDGQLAHFVRKPFDPGELVAKVRSLATAPGHRRAA